MNNPNIIAFLPDFNLSILECRYGYAYTDNSGKIILIYPYWNVDEIKFR